MLDSLGPQLRKKSLSALCKICGHQAILPRSLLVPLCYDRTGDALYNGGYADVWMGEHRGYKVAVKVLRLYTTSDLSKITTVSPSLQPLNRAYHCVCCDYVEVLQRSNNLEKPLSPKRAPASRCDNEWEKFCNGI